MRIEQSYDLPFAPDQVYAAWVSSETVIAPATGMDISPVVGGHYRLIMATPEFTGRNEGRFLVVEPGKHLVYTWEWNGDGEVSEIDVSFIDTPTGTHVAILHSGFENQDSLDNHKSGWDAYMTGLEAFLLTKPR
jgi:uncharacterized protein YndB with AHSA1/START domain